MDQKKIGSVIAYLRKSKNLTQSELAGQLNITDKAISKWERGLATPDVMLLPQLSIILDTDIESILAGNICKYEQNWEGLLILDDKGDNNIYAGTNVYDKPLVYILLSYFLLVGIRKVTIICDKRSYEYISSEPMIKLCKMQIQFGDDIKDYRNQANTMVVLGNLFLYGSNVTRFFQRAMIQINNGCDFVEIVQQNANNNGKFFLNDERYISKKIETDEINVTYDSSGFIFFSYNKRNCFIELIDSLSKNNDSFYENNVYGIGMGRGMLLTNINSNVALLNVSNLMSIIERITDSKIYDIIDIVNNRGLV